MNHIVAIIGSGVSGAEAAARLSEKGIECVVFEQKRIPYGKLESGLPKWHVNLRNMHEAKIDAKLKHSLVHFVPFVRLGEQISVTSLLSDWRFSAVLLATGAWKDRPLPIDGIDDYIGKGLYYQNPFVSWYNHSHVPGFEKGDYEVLPGAVVIGGGLASLDVVKILMIETTRRVLKGRGIDVDPVTLEMRGIPEILKENGLTFEELDIKPCTLYYRRKLHEMPLTPLPPSILPEKREKIYKVRLRIIDNLREKFPFHLVDQVVPSDKIVQNGRLTGLVFQNTEMRDGTLHRLPESSFRIMTNLVISAIGSIPEPVEGIGMQGSTYDVKDPQTGELNGLKNVFALGNAVTGRGNIKDSQMHGRKVADYVHDQYLAWKEEDYREILENAEMNADRKVDGIVARLQQQAAPGDQNVVQIRDRVKALQQKAGYTGDYDAWVDGHKPPRLEDMLK